jgi:2-desacetyl-2-hydroxyethyl bacteriochlorophyllide A dehydrogenase
MTSMRGLMLRGGRKAELEEFEVPEPGAGQALIRIKASGLCGSDLVHYRPAAADGGGLPIIAGHEPAGVIESLGPGPTDFAVGDHVCAYHILGCGRCHECRAGYPVMCSSAERAAYGGRLNGGHAEFMLAEQRALVRLPDNLTFADGAMLACTAGTAYGATLRGEVTGRDVVLVSGLGPVGLTVAQLSLALGARVLAVEPTEYRADLARKLGVEQVFAPGDAAAAHIAEATAGRGASVAIDCSGRDAGRELCLEVLGKWGRAIFVGFGGTRVSFNAPAVIMRKQATLRGSWVCSLSQMEDAAAWLSRLDLHPGDLVTHTFSLDDGAIAYELFDRGETGKVVIAD